jgi:hypothetical protein
MAEIAFASYNQAIPGLEPGLEAVSYYDPPNMTYPFGAYVSVMDVDVDTGEVDIRRFYALDDCGTRINPMIIEGQVHGGLTEAVAIVLGQEIAYDEDGNVKTGTLMDFFMLRITRPTGPPPHHRTTRSAPRASAKARMSAASRASPTRSTTPSGPSVTSTPRCRTTTGGSGRSPRGWGCMAKPIAAPRRVGGFYPPFPGMAGP